MIITPIVISLIFLIDYVYPQKKNKKLELLRLAKEIYIWKPDIPGMCYCLKKAYNLTYHEELQGQISRVIPEFTPKTFGLDYTLGYWWDPEDRESRINAFNKLIGIYEKKL